MGQLPRACLQNCSHHSLQDPQDFLHSGLLPALWGSWPLMSPLLSKLPNVFSAPAAGDPSPQQLHPSAEASPRLSWPAFPLAPIFSPFFNRYQCYHHRPVVFYALHIGQRELFFKQRGCKFSRVNPLPPQRSLRFIFPGWECAVPDSFAWKNLGVHSQGVLVIRHTWSPNRESVLMIRLRFLPKAIPKRRRADPATMR